MANLKQNLLIQSTYPRGTDPLESLMLLRKQGFTNLHDFAAKLGVSLDIANDLFRALSQAGWVDSVGCLTPAGIETLKPYKVDNAIIMAAGLSSRFAPLSYEKPKGLLVVKGEVLIERQIRQLMEAGINDITVVAGYMKDKFYYLEDKFKGLKVVDNDDYYRYNNTSTLMRVLDKLQNTYICSSDNYFTQNIFEEYVYSAYYAATYFPGSVNEWGIEVNKKDVIIGIEHRPVDMWCMMGHVYFDRKFSAAFRAILEKEYENLDVKKELWESVYERNIKELEMVIRRYPDGIIYEFDSLDDLRRFDTGFLYNSGSDIIHGICEKLQCAEMDISGIKVVDGDMSNLAFVFSCKGKAYLYRKSTNTVERIDE